MKVNAIRQFYTTFNQVFKLTKETDGFEKFEQKSFEYHKKQKEALEWHHFKIAIFCFAKERDLKISKSNKIV